MSVATPSQPKVLVADDNRVIREVLGSRLVQLGASISLAGDGLEALEKIRREAFDVVLLDIHMPMMGGLEVVRSVGKAPGAYKSMPNFVGVSASPSLALRKSCFDAGMVDYLCKPIWQRDLSERLLLWCRASKGTFLKG